MLIDREAGDKNSQVKVNPRKTGEAQGHTEKIESLHAEISERLEMLQGLRCKEWGSAIARPRAYFSS